MKVKWLGKFRKKQLKAWLKKTEENIYRDIAIGLGPLGKEYAEAARDARGFRLYTRWAGKAAVARAMRIREELPKASSLVRACRTLDLVDRLTEAQRRASLDRCPSPPFGATHTWVDEAIPEAPNEKSNL